MTAAERARRGIGGGDTGVSYAVPRDRPDRRRSAAADGSPRDCHACRSSRSLGSSQIVVRDKPWTDTYVAGPLAGLRTRRPRRPARGGHRRARPGQQRQGHQQGDDRRLQEPAAAPAVHRRPGRRHRWPHRRGRVRCCWPNARWTSSARPPPKPTSPASRSPTWCGPRRSGRTAHPDEVFEHERAALRQALDTAIDRTPSDHRNFVANENSGRRADATS